MVFFLPWPSASKKSLLGVISVPGIVLASAAPGFAAAYLTLEQAQQAIFPQESFASVELNLTDEQHRAFKDKTGMSFNPGRQKIWRTSRGGIFIVDEVIGKHELITYAVGIEPGGSVRQIEIMNYREAYGDEVRQKKWRRQFIGKTNASAVSLNKDIKNISGATLSCRHVTEGVKRLLNLYELVLRK